METGGVEWHVLAAYATVALGVLGPLSAIAYAVRVEQRDWWRRPMMVGAVLAFGAVLLAELSGHRMVEADPGLLADPSVSPHLAYADRLVLPAAGYFVVGVLTGLLNPRTGALRVALPLLLTGFAVVVLVLTVLSGDDGMRSLWDRVSDQF
ncbi:hypothetical protein [Nocardioides euryhalodurans]|uniref:Uncharacterized protein n=1 Tax=Nocardioides euryhalodurans TaxID=2518370 RepID=A0A4P7GJG0_9ACTN|nr:hypothetical protein [Nocardioides euryhalodurans]QBR91771.1 hypothetical protein EXE57_05415 [Nocardioides euryhalodurans]